MSVLQTVQKNNRQFTYGQTVQKKQQTIYIWTDSAKNNNKQFTYGQTVFTLKKGENTYCIIQFSRRTVIWVTIAILNAAWMTYNGEIVNYYLKSMERRRYPASMADKQSSFPELNMPLRHILIVASLTNIPLLITCILQLPCHSSYHS